ncbi:SDR family oxidoreductase [Pseudomonas sp. JL972]|uniref:SDR family NAD(P)-dependent oxidoreductase n=1 Tax=Stutzerimonas degradans TaxID=2968968 RepID=UPI0012D8E045|nr:SDR family oxidoreductase [Stutzerimonas degradans]MTZ15520.1 SDR family oxidoreductase [Stutzerimonas degradans]
MNSLGKFSLKGKTALVTGAAGYLGSAMSVALADAGAHVILNVRSGARGEPLLRTIEAFGGSAELLELDVSDEVAVQDYFTQNGPSALHVLVNNAYKGMGGTIETSSADDYLASYQVSLVAAHNMLKCALPALRCAVQQTGDASVINIASMYGVVSPDHRVYESPADTNPPFYGATKAALVQWSKYAACEFGLEGIRVNAISPGPFPSSSVQESAPEFVGKLASKVPMGRIGQACEIAGPILFLASAASSFVNGVNLSVDGGWTAW